MHTVLNINAVQIKQIVRPVLLKRSFTLKTLFIHIDALTSDAY